MSGEVAVRSDGSGGLPAGTVSTANLLELPADLPFAEWRRVGERLLSTEDRLSWTLGDWRVHGDRFSGEYGDALQALDLASPTAFRCAWVCRAFPGERRRLALTFKHHQVVAAKSDGEQDLWLNEAERHGWSARELEERVAQKRISGDRPAALSLRAIGPMVERFESRAEALGVPARELALEVLELASQLDDPVAALEAAGARRLVAGREG